MSERFETPVVVILFNRPERIRALVAALRPIRPTRIFAIADGPRKSHPRDHDACRLARAALDEIDWPCAIEREFAETNLGCDPRTMSGLDWAFGRIDRAVILEDDLLPHPSFLPWAARALERFDDDPELAMVSGRNPLGCWGDGPVDHVRARRGSVWGWATTASAWRETNAVDLRGDPADARRDLAKLSLDPLVAEYHAIALESYRLGTLRPWDMTWSLRMAFRAAAAIVSSVNLVHNAGFGPEATHTLNPEDFTVLVPAGEPRTPVAHAPPRADSAFDRAALLVQLLARCVDPEMAWRLARLTRRGAQIPLNAAARLYLAPFAVPADSLAVLEHLARQGVTSPTFDRLLRTMQEITAGSST